MAGKAINAGIARTLRAARAAARLSQRELAERTTGTISRSGIAQVEQAIMAVRRETADRLIAVLSEAGAPRDLVAAFDDAVRARAARLDPWMPAVQPPGVGVAPQAESPPAVAEAVARRLRMQAVALLRHLHSGGLSLDGGLDPWALFCRNYEVMCALAAVSRSYARLGAQFLAGLRSGDYAAMENWVSGLLPRDTHVLLYAAVFTLSPVEFAEAGFFRPEAFRQFDAPGGAGEVLLRRVPVPINLEGVGGAVGDE